MKILVLSENYSTKEKISQAFIHTRNVEYMKKGILVDVISFAANNKYEYEGINVYSEKDFYNERKIEEYDIIVSHAPNIRNHCKFISKNANKIKKIVFFFHGHEVLISKEIYPKPYKFVKKEKFLKETIRNIYDIMKLKYLKRFFNKFINISTYIFVSEWMYEQFKKNIKIKESKYKDISYIIYNSLGEKFLKETYDDTKEKKYDFITIRNILDVSKYSIDLVNDIAKKYPKYKFLVVGKGEFFKHNEAPSNLKYELKNLNHDEIIKYLNESKYALMPTRADAQGVMMCEMATFGIPLITSNIYVCKKVLGDLENVRFIENDINKVDLDATIEGLKKSRVKTKKFSYDNTILKEIDIFNKILNKKEE